MRSLSRLGMRLLFVGVVFLHPQYAQAQAWPNEPAGSTVLLDCDFSHPTCNGLLYDPYNTSNTLPNPPSAGTLNVVNDPTAPLSPSSVVRSSLFYPSKSGGTQLEFRAPTQINEVYVGFWWRSSPGFTGSAVGANKMLFIRGGPGENGLLAWQKPRDSSGISRLYWTSQIPFQNLDQCSGIDVDQCFSNTGNDVVIQPGTWYRIEIYLKASSCATCHDGIVRWWIDGVMAGNYENYAYGPRADEIVWAETWDGGGSGTGHSPDTYHQIDHLYISAPNCPNGCPVTGNTGGGSTGGTKVEKGAVCDPIPDVEIYVEKDKPAPVGQAIRDALGRN